MAISHQPMNKLSGADVRRLLNGLFLKARLKVRMFARVGDRLRSPPRGLLAAVFLASYLAAATDFTAMVSPLAVPVTLARSHASLLSSSNAALSDVLRL